MKYVSRSPSLESVKPFRLVRYYGLTSLVVILLFAVTFSGVMGNSQILACTASAMALAIAGAGGIMLGSPTPFAPYGPSSEGACTIITSMGGVSQAVGIL